MFKVYKSLNPIDINNPPDPIAVDVIDTTFIDADVTLGDRFYYRVSATKNGIEKFSDQVIGIAGEIDEYFSYVELLIFADAESFPSIVFSDKSNNNLGLVRYGDVKIVSPNTLPASYDDGWISFPVQTGARLYTNSAMSALGVVDFTYEQFILQQSGVTLGYNYLAFFGGQFVDNTISILITSDRSIWVEGKFTYQRIIFIEGSTKFQLDTPNHICLMRKNGVFYLFLNGVRIGISSDYISNSIPAGVITLGNVPGATTAANGYKGHMAGIRLTREVARYPETGFIVPTSKYPH